MRQGGNHQRRQRSGRPNGKRPFNFGPNRSFELNGPGVKLRGTAAQVFDKYLALARDASSSGDRVAAENFYQHAEHYFRLHAAFTARREAERQNGGSPNISRANSSISKGASRARATTTSMGTSTVRRSSNRCTAKHRPAMRS